MTRDAVTTTARWRSASARNAALAVVGHALLATVAVAGCLRLIRAPFDDANLPTQLVQASGIVALIWAYAGLVVGLLIGIRPVRGRFGGQPSRLYARPGRSVILALHRQLNLVVLALVLLHAVVFAIGMPGGSLLVALWHALALGTVIRIDGVARTLTWALQIPLLMLIVLRLLRPRRPADQLSATLRRGRYSGPANGRLRAAIALGLFSSAVLILLMALLAGSQGLRVDG
jgi:hypothetical protein